MKRKINCYLAFGTVCLATTFCLMVAAVIRLPGLAYVEGYWIEAAIILAIWLSSRIPLFGVDWAIARIAKIREEQRGGV